MQAQATETYTPSGRIGLASIPLMLALGGGSALAVSFLVHQIWMWTGFYLIFLFPAAIGFAGGIGLAVGNRVGRNRNPWVSMAVGAVIAVSAYVLMHYLDSRAAGAPGLWAYLVETAEVGYTLFFIPLIGPLAWLSWILELGVAAYFTVKMAAASASQPYCEPCGLWCEEVELFSADRARRGDLLRALDTGAFAELQGFETDAPEKDRLKVELAYCDSCRRIGFVSVTDVVPKDGKDSEEEVLRAYVAAGPAVGQLLGAFLSAGADHAATFSKS